MTKSNTTRLLTLLMIIFVALQAAFTGIPVTDPKVPNVMALDESVKTWITATLMFFVVIVTAWKNYLSVEIRDGSNYAMLFIAFIAILGGLNDFIKVVPINQVTGAWIRFGITTVTGILNVSSKTLWPTPESKAVESLKSNLS